MKLLLTFILLSSTSVVMTFEKPKKNEIIGQKTQEATVVLSSPELHVRSCKQFKKGFYIAHITGTNDIVFYCGTKYKMGDKIILKLNEGI